MFVFGWNNDALQPGAGNNVCIRKTKVFASHEKRKRRESNTRQFNTTFTFKRIFQKSPNRITRIKQNRNGKMIVMLRRPIAEFAMALRLHVTTSGYEGKTCNNHKKRKQKQCFTPRESQSNKNAQNNTTRSKDILEKTETNQHIFSSNGSSTKKRKSRKKQFTQTRGNIWESEQHNMELPWK